MSLGLNTLLEVNNTFCLLRVRLEYLAAVNKNRGDLLVLKMIGTISLVLFSFSSREKDYVESCVRRY